MQVSIEAVNKIERRLTITVPAEQLDQAYNKGVLKFAQNVKLKGGFRPGKLPALKYIEKHYGQAVQQDALKEVIQSSLYAAFAQEKLNPIGTPQIEPKAMEPGKPLEFTAIIEVLPEIDAINFKAASLEKAVANVTEGDVDKVITRLREQHTQWQEVDRPAQEKDQVVIDFRGAIDGKFFAGGEAHEYPIIIGSKTMIPGFEEGIVGINKGEERVIQVQFPENYFANEMAGKTAEFTISAHKVSEPNLPALDEAFIKKIGIKSGELTELKNEIQKSLSREVERTTKAKFKNKVFDMLLEQNPLDLPKALVEQEAQRVHDQVHPHHGKEHHHTDAEMAVFTDSAKKNVALGLLVSEFIKQHKLAADQEKVQDHIASLAAAYENPDEIIQWYAKDKRRMAEVEMQVLEDQVVEKLLEGITVTEKLLNYDELING